jgi:hypothetical protein
MGPMDTTAPIYSAEKKGHGVHCVESIMWLFLEIRGFHTKYTRYAKYAKPF